MGTGDLDSIADSGTLRILFPLRGTPSHLPRSGYPLDFERDLANAYASRMGLQPVWIYIESRGALLDALQRGEGDLIAANLTATDERRQTVDFTVPIAVVREQLVTRAEDDSIRSIADLAGRKIALRPSSSFWETVQKLQERVPELEIEMIPEELDTEDAIDRVAQGEYDLTVADSNLIDACLEYRDDIRAALDLSDDRPIAWAVRQNTPKLRESLDAFLTDFQLARRQASIAVGDWEEIRQRKVLRLLTRNNAANYFLWRGQLLGFEYELAKEFARQNGLFLEVVVPPKQADLYSWLLEGRGDLIAASQIRTEWRESQGIAFSRPYNYVDQIVVAPADYPDLVTAAELEGHDFFVRRTSTYWNVLEELRRDGIGLLLHPAPEDMETEEIIDEVALGRVGLTLADSHILDISMSWRDDVRALLPLREGVGLAWAVRADNPDLLDAVNRFIASEYRGLFYNITYRKYFHDVVKIRRHIAGRSDTLGELSPYDDIVRRFADQYGFDWRLIVAQMFQESRFDPKAQSFAGAQGLMQVLPATAAQLGIDAMEEPETMIYAGVKYLDWIRDRFEPELSVRDRMWFTLAAYNAGTGHVQEARRLAGRKGWNPNIWFDNVERAMLLLQQPRYASESRYGYCRCSEPVQYVRSIRELYTAYLDIESEPQVDQSEQAVLRRKILEEHRIAPTGVEVTPASHTTTP